MISANEKTLSRRSFLGTLGGLAATTAFSPQATAQAPKQLLAGAALTDITPEPGASLAGHMNDRKADAIHDPLYARCLTLDDGDSRLVLVMVDNCLIPREIFDAARKRIAAENGIPPENILMAATHTHSGPTTTPVFQSEPVPGYDALLVERIAETVARAVARLEAVEIAWGCGSVPNEVFNRRWYMKPGSIPANPFGETSDKVRMNPPRADENLLRPAGPKDGFIPFIVLRRLDHSPLALVANYALHYVGGVEGNDISADYFGYFANAVKTLLAPDAAPDDFVAMMSNGASGNINNINFKIAAEPMEPYEKMRIVANKAAEEVHRMYQQIEFRNWAPLAATASEITLGVRRPNDQELERAHSIVAAAKGPEMRTMEEIYARETLLMAEYPETVPLMLQTLIIGDVGIAAIPCEVFCEIGIMIKATSTLPLSFPIELANGYNGYLPTAEQHALGGYETWRARSSYLEVAAAERIASEINVLFRNTKEKIKQKNGA